MTQPEWLDQLPNYARATESGARIDLRLYVYPDGHGNIQFLRSDGRGGDQQPVDRPEEAIDALRALWERSANLRDASGGDTKARRERGRRMAETLEQIAALKARHEIEDPVAWQREQREDRPLPGREP